MRTAEPSVTQLWPAIDYWTAGWDAIGYADAELIQADDPVDTYSAVGITWVIAADGEEEEEEVVLLADEFQAWDHAGARLTLLEGPAVGTPDVLWEAVQLRERTRRAAYRESAKILNEASPGDVLWLRLIGGESVAGKLKSLGTDSVVLDQARNMDYPNEQRAGYLDARLIAAVRNTGPLGLARRMPKKFYGPEFGSWWGETNRLTEVPALWKALCEECINAVRPPWRTDDCYMCRAGNPQGIPDSYYSFDKTAEQFIDSLDYEAEAMYKRAQRESGY